jgi:hypothetical protein
VIRRISIGYSVTATTSEAISAARSWSASTIQYPASDSLISANGPSVGTGAPSANRTVVAWDGSVRCPTIHDLARFPQLVIHPHHRGLHPADPFRVPVRQCGTQPTEHHDHVLHR